MPSAMTVQETAERLHISKDSVRRLVREGKLPSIRLLPGKILIPVAAVDEIVGAAMASRQSSLN
jgi:excisionase family DNA binding protein